MCMKKIMILPACLGILLVGIVMLPSVFAAGGCGEGTVLVDGVCQLAPVESSGCGEGTVLVNGVCQLAKTGSPFNILSGSTIEPLYIVIAVVTIGGVIGAIFAVRKGSKTAKPTQQEPKRVKTSVETKEASEFCKSCGTSLKPEARFCGKCGSRQ